MKTLRRLGCLGLASAAFVAGCGSLGDVEHRAPLAVLNGQLTASSTQAVAAPSNVRIAVVWQQIGERSGSYRVAQDVPATPIFPSQFRLELTDPPPVEAMWTGAARNAAEASDDPPIAEGSGGATPPDPGPAPTPNPGGAKTANHKTAWPADFGVAVGAVIAYEDRNGNGRLDLVEEGAESFVDRVLGANESMLLVYIEGTTFPSEIDGPDGTKPTAGYSLMQIASCAKEVGGGGSDEATIDSCNGQSGWRPITTLYDLPLTAEPRFADLMCKRDSGFGFGGGSVSKVSGGGTAPGGGSPLPTAPGPDGWPAKGDPNLYCGPEGITYTISKCETYSEGLCKGTITRCTNATYITPSVPPPPEWPCPTQP